jgi:NAD(P)-dependent dehydrogenase (short-subunit alcohol dehydrogenase family)
MYFAGIQTGLATIYGGHVAVTSAFLQALAARSAGGYARILFTTSVQAYLDGGGDLGLTYGHNYTASKRALLAYANALRRILGASGLAIKVSTLNPLWVNTAIATGQDPYFYNRRRQWQCHRRSKFSIITRRISCSCRHRPADFVAAQAYVQTTDSNPILKQTSSWVRM